MACPDSITDSRLVEADFRVYTSIVRITLASEGTFSIRLVVDDAGHIQ